MLSDGFKLVMTERRCQLRCRRSGTAQRVWGSPIASPLACCRVRRCRCYATRRVTVGVLQGRSLPMLRDAPGGTFVLVQVVRGALKGGVDAVVVLLQNRFGAYALRALNGKAAVRAVNAARNDVVAHG